MTETTTTIETTENAPARFEIPVENVPALEAKLEKLARRAVKLGSPISFVWGKDLVKRVRVECPTCAGHRCSFCDHTGSRTINCAFREITVSTARPKFAGWDFLGTLDHTEVPGQVLRLMVPGVEAPAEAVNAKPGQCDHCGKVRRRHQTFVVRNGEAVKIVGRSCIADFLGHQSPEHFAAMLSFVHEVSGSLEESERGGGGGYRAEACDVIRTLAGVFALARTEGYKPAKYEEKSTRSVITHLLWPGRMAREQQAAQDFWASVTLADYQRAWSALTWLAESTDASDFMSNLRIVAGAPYVSGKTLGLLCAIVPAFDRDAIRRSAPRAPSVHVGAIGERRPFGLGEVMHLFFFDSQFGTQAVVLIRLDGGEILKWKTSASSLEACVAKGARVTVAKATVKEHTEYEGTPQTIITRAVIEAAPATEAA